MSRLLTGARKVKSFPGSGAPPSPSAVSRLTMAKSARASVSRTAVVSASGCVSRPRAAALEVDVARKGEGDPAGRPTGRLRDARRGRRTRGRRPRSPRTGSRRNRSRRTRRRRTRRRRSRGDSCWSRGSRESTSHDALDPQAEDGDHVCREAAAQQHRGEAPRRPDHASRLGGGTSDEAHPGPRVASSHGTRWVHSGVENFVSTSCCASASSAAV